MISTNNIEMCNLCGRSNNTSNTYFQIRKWYVVTNLEKNVTFFKILHTTKNNRMATTHKINCAFSLVVVNNELLACALWYTDHKHTHTLYRQSLLSWPWAKQLYCVESLYLLGHNCDSCMLRDTIKIKPALTII
jgi:hypothetical protein